MPQHGFGVHGYPFGNYTLLAGDGVSRGLGSWAAGGSFRVRFAARTLLQAGRTPGDGAPRGACFMMQRLRGHGNRAPTQLCTDAVPASCSVNPLLATEQVNPFLSVFALCLHQTMWSAEAKLPRPLKLPLQHSKRCCTPRIPFQAQRAKPNPLRKGGPSGREEVLKVILPIGSQSLAQGRSFGTE
ncbi:hypothetical protein HRbin14_01750 [bacterium HR14]|nr:hypothetical protein HRbin14_01750 [bacterium HR14]